MSIIQAESTETKMLIMCHFVSNKPLFYKYMRMHHNLHFMIVVYRKGMFE